MTSAARLRLSDLVGGGEKYHVSRVTVRREQRMALHTHDFAEVFWIEQGRGVHIVNGDRHELEPGHVVLMRPDDEHTFRTIDPRGLTQVNVAFERSTLDFLRERYFDGRTWPWAGCDLPAVFKLERGKAGGPGEFAGPLFAGPANRLLLDRFLLGLLHRLSAPTAVSGVPLWLSEALDRLAHDGAALQAGVPALAKLAGRSREHVNRVARRGTGRTATELVQEVRLEHAAADLRLTDHPISRVAIDCGSANLSHFHRLFKARFGLTPLRYRQQHRALVSGELRSAELEAGGERNA